MFFEELRTHLKRRELHEKRWLKQERLQFAEKRVRTNKKRRRVIFTDEKRFNLDEPGSLHYYYHHLRKEQLLLSRRL